MYTLYLRLTRHRRVIRKFGKFTIWLSFVAALQFCVIELMKAPALNVLGYSLCTVVGFYLLLEVLGLPKRRSSQVRTKSDFRTAAVRLPFFALCVLLATSLVKRPPLPTVILCTLCEFCLFGLFLEPMERLLSYISRYLKHRSHTE